MKKIRLNLYKTKSRKQLKYHNMHSVLSYFNTSNTRNDNNDLLATGYISSRGIYPMRASSHESFAENLRVDIISTLKMRTLGLRKVK